MASDEKDNMRDCLSESKKSDFLVTKKALERTIALPFFKNLREEEIDYVKIISSL